MSCKVGLWQSLPHASISRYLARMGWDFVVLDMQHGPMSFETAYECMHTLRDGGTEPWIRVSIGNPSEVQRALDLGAQAVVVPMVNSVETARRMAQAAKYPPLGERSIGGDFAVQQGVDYPECANRQTKLLVQIEHIDAVNSVEDMMAIPGVDGCFVGPTDLAVSMGLPRDNFAAHPDHRGALERTRRATLSQGRLCCCNTYSPADAEQRFAEGYTHVTFQSEVDLFVDAGLRLRKELLRIRETAEANHQTN